MSGPGTAA
nr:fibroblast growth factor-4 signal peptide [synthetic construct]